MVQGVLLSPGDRLGDYEIVAPLTSGGMATLVLAQRRGVGGFSRLVALKLVHRALTNDSSMVDLFLQEARLSARISHPNVVHVEEVGVHEGVHFIAMEYVHGVSLSRVVSRLRQSRRRMAPQLTVYIAAQIAEALHAAHEATNEHGQSLNIVHRDVSPQNVLMTHTGHVKLIDFGIARCGQSESDPAGAMGKLRYMAPEQVSCDEVDRRTDVYALGIMVWEMLTGRSLFRSDTPREHLADRRDAIAPPSKYDPTLSSRLDRVVLKALAFDPHRRFRTALHFRRALLQAMQPAARLDAPKVAGVLGAVVGMEMDELRERLPQEITAHLKLDDGPQADPDAASELMTEGDADPSDEHQINPLPPQPLYAIDENTANPTSRYVASPPPERDRETPSGVWLPSSVRAPAPRAALLATALVCGLTGMVLGRAMAPTAIPPGYVREASEPVTAPENPVSSVSAVSAAPAAPDVSAIVVEELTVQDPEPSIESAAVPTPVAISTVAAKPAPKPRKMGPKARRQRQLQLKRLRAKRLRQKRAAQRQRARKGHARPAAKGRSAG